MNVGCIAPLEILFAIMAQSSVPTISSLMKTCHALYEEGPRHILRDGCRLNWSHIVDSFVSFMFARDTTRFVYLTKLIVDVTLCTPGAPQKPKGNIIRLLSSPTLNLDTLELYNTDIFSRLDNRVHAAFSQLTTIKHLHLRTMGIESITTMLQSIPSALVSLTVTAQNGSWGPHLLQDIAKHSQTLKELRWNLRGVSDVPVLPEAFSLPPHSPLPQFPRVRKFVAVCNESQPDALKTAALTEAFPNLAILHLVRPTTFIDTYSGLYSQNTAVPQAIRERNQREQLERDSRRWASLTECSGELVNLYSLGLLCHVERLTVWTTMSCDEDISMLRQVCQDVYPKYLYVRSCARNLKALHSTVEDQTACGTLRTLVVGFDNSEFGRTSLRREYSLVSP